MSFKRQLQFKYRHVLNIIQALTLPQWMVGVPMRASLTLVIVLFGGAYVMQTASSASRGYELSGLENQISSYETDIQKIQVEVARESSLATLNAKLPKTGMVAVADMKFLAPVGDMMARR